MSGEVRDQPTRRRYSAAYKVAILAEYDSLDRDPAKESCCNAKACTHRCCRNGANNATRAHGRRSTAGPGGDESILPWWNFARSRKAEVDFVEGQLLLSPS